MINDEQKIAWNKIVNSDLFKSIEDHVLSQIDVSVDGLPAPEMGMALAIQKGAREAFKKLKLISDPTRVPRPTLQPKTLSTKLNETTN